MNTLKLTEPVGTTAANDYRKTEAFTKMDIDFFCDGNKTLKEADPKVRESAEQLKAKSEQLSAQNANLSQEFDDWNLDALTDYILKTHHEYAKANGVIVYELAQKVAFHYRENHPELIKLASELFLFLHDLLNHMKKEEEILFPNIKQLVKNKRHSGKLSYTTFGLIKEWVTLMQEEHQSTAKSLKLFNELTNYYQLPEDACSSYTSLFEKLKAFEDDLLLHIHLENNILFPKALIEDAGLDENTVKMETI
jgi:regulator of cell morphogenesis and NO signaling